MSDIKISKKRKELEKDLLFYLRYYQKIPPDLRGRFDAVISELVEKLKES